jgi:hypothetical protein
MIIPMAQVDYLDLRFFTPKGQASFRMAIILNRYLDFASPTESHVS